MKISRNWLQTFFDKPLPDAQKISDELTFHAFEIEGVEKNGDDDILDVSVLPNRGHDCLSHRGIAKEISAILNIPLKNDPLREKVTLTPTTDAVNVTIEDSELCRRFAGAYIKNAKVGPSSEWLQKRLESVGQKSINNVVDATNFVMLDVGQPLHAFDAGKLTQENGGYAMTIRLAKKGEILLGLDEKKYSLTPSMLAIVDSHTNEVVSVAGIKGGMATGIDDSTDDIILEAANWDGVTIRKTSQALKLRTDASARFEQEISPELAEHGTLAAAKLVCELTGGELAGFVDVYPKPQVKKTVSVTVAKVNKILGTNLSEHEMTDVFTRLDLPFGKKGDEFVVRVPSERLDISIVEDLAEEVARIIGYDKISAPGLPPFEENIEIDGKFYAAENTREDLMEKGYSEVLTSVFAGTGKRQVLNKVGGGKSYLRTNLVDGLNEALQRNVLNKDLLGLEEVKLFEIGTIWKKDSEEIVVATISEKEKAKEWKLESKDATECDNLPLSGAERYKTFSKYPYIVRDVALWVPSDTESDSILSLIRERAGKLLVRSEKFDEFKKDDKTSYAYRLVLQSFDRTLTDDEANKCMENVYAGLTSKGFEIR